MQTPAPIDWLQRIQWPIIVVAAFWLGRSMSKLEARVWKAEANVQALIERHMPHIHRALSDIKSSIAVLQASMRRP